MRPGGMLMCRRMRSVVLAAMVAAAASTALADSGQTSRAVIRGTGTDVTIVYKARPGVPSEAAGPSDPLKEALRLKAAGADDQEVVAFLRRSQAWLPDVIDARVVKELRKAGAGEPVIAFVSANVALDVGETAESAPVAAMPSTPDVAPFPAGYQDLATSGYPFYGGGAGYGIYGGGYGAFGRPFGHRFPRHSAFLRFGRGFPPRPHPSPRPRSHGLASRPRIRW